MVFQYTLGDSFKNNSEKKELQKQQIKQYQDFFITPEKKDRALSIKQSYPNIPTGVVSSLVETNANNSQIRQAAVEQARIESLNNKNYTKMPPEYASVLRNYTYSTYGDFDETETSSALKRGVNFAFNLWSHLHESLIFRQLRAQVMLSDEIEQNLISQGATKEEAKRIARTYTFSSMILPGKTEAAAIANGVARLMGRKELGISKDYRGIKGEKKLASYYDKAGTSALQYGFQEILKREGLDENELLKNIPKLYKKLGMKGVSEAYDEFFGNTIIPSGKGIDEAEKIKESIKYNDRSITAGRYIENSLGIEGDEDFNIVSGTIDAALLFFTDPAIFAGKSRAAMRGLKSIKAEIKKKIDAGDIQDARQIARDTIATDKFKNVAEIIINDKTPDKFIKLARANKDPVYALKLYEAKSVDDVIDAASSAILEGTSWNVPKINQTKIIPDWLNNSTYKAFGKKRATAKGNDPLSRVGKYIPEREVNLQDWSKTVDTLINHGTVGKIARKDLNNIAVKLTKSLINDDYRGAQKILTKDYYGKLVEKVSDNPKTVESFKNHQDKLFGFRDNNVLYSIDQAALKSDGSIKPITNGMLRNTKVGNDVVNLQTPFPDQVMDRTFYFTDHRDLRRAVKNVDGVVAKAFPKIKKEFNPDTPLGKVLSSKDIDSPLELTKEISDIWADNIVDKAWTFQRWWSTANLPFRLAYPLRLVLEGQPRMAVYGLDSLVNNPVSYWNYLTVLDEDILGKKFVTDAWSKNNRRLQESLDKAVSNASNKHFGPKNIKGYINENFSPFVASSRILQKEGADELTRFSEAIRIQLAGIWREPIAQNIAETISKSKSFDDLVERFWSGDLKKTRIAYENTLDRVDKFTNKEGAKKFLEGYNQRILELTGGDTELIESIATGFYKNIDVRSWDRHKTANSKKIIDGIKNMMKTSDNRPLAVPAPDDLIDTTFKEYKKANLDEVPFSSLWFMAGAMEANVNRIPAYKQLYFRSVADDLQQANPEAAKKLIERINKLPKNIRRELQELYPKLNKSIDKITDNNLPKLTLEQIDNRAQLFALEEHNRILYNLSQKGLVADSLRFVFPFFEAYKEVTLSWGKALLQNQKYGRRAEMIIKGARSEGILHKDPVSDEDMLSVPLPSFVQNVLAGGRLFQGDGDTQNILNANMEIPISGLNLISTSLLPGVGPVISTLVGPAKDRILSTDVIDGRYLWKTVFPYGTNVEDVADLSNPEWFVNTLLPNYLKTFIAALNTTKQSNLESIVGENKIATRVLDAAKVVASNMTSPLQNEKDAKEFDENVIRVARNRLLIESALQFMTPAPPRIILKREIKKDEAEKLLKAVLGDTEIGKLTTQDKKTYAAFGVLSAFYSQLKQEYQKDPEIGLDEGETLAWITYNRVLDTSASNYQDMFGTSILKEGKYQYTEGKNPRFEREVEFKQNNKDLFKEYPLTATYLTPDIEEEGEFDDLAFFESLDAGELEAIDPLMFAIEAQEFLYRMATEAPLKQLQNNRSDEGIALRRLIKNRAAELFPLGIPGDKGINYDVLTGREVKPKKDSDYYARIKELKRMAQDTSLADVSEQWVAVNNYFAAREQALIKIAEAGGYNYPEDMVLIENRLKDGTTDVQQGVREILRSYASQLTSQYPSFLVMYNELLRYEIKFNKED